MNRLAILGLLMLCGCGFHAYPVADDISFRKFTLDVDVQFVATHDCKEVMRTIEQVEGYDTSANLTWFKCIGSESLIPVPDYELNSIELERIYEKTVGHRTVDI